MVSREGEEAEYHETDSNISTPPRMGSIKIASHDPLQARLSNESCQKLGKRNCQVLLYDYDQEVNQEKEIDNSSINPDGATVKIDMRMERISSDVEQHQPRVPPIHQGRSNQTRHEFY